MTIAASFLGGAKSRLLPRSIPFRFFASAATFHVLMWLALLFGADASGPYRTKFRLLFAASRAFFSVSR